MASKKSLDFIRAISEHVIKSGGFESVLKRVRKITAPKMHLIERYNIHISS